MGFRDIGNPPLNSTGLGSTAVGSNPSSGVVVAEIPNLQDRLYEVRFCPGASTIANWKLQHVLSTGLGSTAIRNEKYVFTGTNQSAEFVFLYKAEAGDLFRVVTSTSFSGTYGVHIQAEVVS
jgi:hypothetical protein